MTWPRSVPAGQHALPRQICPYRHLLIASPEAREGGRFAQNEASLYARRVLLITAVALGSTVFALPPFAHAAFPGDNGKIAFAYRPPSDVGAHIYAANPDGTGLTPIAGVNTFC